MVIPLERVIIYLIALIVVVLLAIVYVGTAQASECEIIQDTMKCFGSVGVVQEGLDDLDIRTLFSIWQAKANGTYGGPATLEIIDVPEPVPFKHLRLNTDDFKTEQDRANEAICNHNMYGNNFKVQHGCTMNPDGTYSWK